MQNQRKIQIRLIARFYKHKRLYQFTVIFNPMEYKSKHNQGVVVPKLLLFFNSFDGIHQPLLGDATGCFFL